MDRWVVKGVNGRSRIEDLSGDSSVRGARIRDVLASRTSAGQRRLSARGVEPGGRGARPGIRRPFGIGRMAARAIAAVPGRTSPRCVRILAITVGSSMAAMSFKVPPHCGHCSMSISNTRLSNRAQLRRTGATAGGTSAWSAEGVLVLTGTLGMPDPGMWPAWCPEDGMISLLSKQLRYACPVYLPERGGVGPRRARSARLSFVTSLAFLLHG